MELQNQVKYAGKEWYRSKTILMNGLILLGVITKGITGFEITSDETLAIVGVVNLVLRATTKEGLKV